MFIPGHFLPLPDAARRLPRAAGPEGRRTRLRHGGWHEAAGGGRYNDVVNSKVFRLSSTERERLFEQIATYLARQPDVAFAYVLGSSLTEPAFRDIDVALYLSAPAADHSGRALELAERLTREVGIPVDVRPLNDASIAFVFHAVRGRLLVSRDNERLATTIEETVRRHLDIAPLLRHATREAFGS
jgi:uncharacterized protein